MHSSREPRLPLLRCNNTLKRTKHGHQRAFRWLRAANHPLPSAVCITCNRLVCDRDTLPPCEAGRIYPSFTLISISPDPTTWLQRSRCCWLYPHLHKYFECCEARVVAGKTKCWSSTLPTLCPAKRLFALAWKAKD